ncbi:hypothetical protein [Anaerovorax sp. IOR16]|uniref:hypothetical protein n=1 Tax=Anaerovorax sp. IOR16 TaxID=2773458 RepID=UPI0019D1811D|nr:hypothetical protein [Anaerovorax sp. IOR16]
MDTNDFPRLPTEDPDEIGDIDPSFDDYRIKCKNNIAIRHGCQNILSCYIPSLGRGLNILRKIYNDNIEPYKKQSNDEIVKALENNILLDIDILSSEIYFTFKTDKLKYIAELVGAIKSGANISPFSTKNLPKNRYTIPDNNMKDYKNVLGNVKFGDSKAIKLNSINKSFENVLIEKCGDGYKKERKKLALDNKSYIHYKGLWNEYLEFIKKNMEDN